MIPEVFSRALRHALPRGKRAASAAVNDERGSAVSVMVLALLLVICGAVGLAIDHTRSTYIRASIQDQLDMATVAGASQVRAGDRDVNMTLEAAAVEGKATEVAREVYAENRRQAYANPAPGVDKSYSPTAGVNCTGQGGACGVPECAINADQTSLTCTVHERSRSLWLNLIGIEGQNYTVRSTAALKLADQ